MSFIDVATLTLHRRHEMELRVDSFLEKCDNVIRNIQRLKTHTQTFSAQLNCESAELKERYLNCIRQLEEYTYLITDFNIAVSIIEENDAAENTPVQDKSVPKHEILQPQKINLMDVLSDTAPSTSTQCFKNYSEAKLKRHRHKLEQTLIVFSSVSNSDESLFRGENVEKTDERSPLAENKKKLAVNAEAQSPGLVEWPSLPAQQVLELDHTYPAIIMGVEGASFWITTQELSVFNNLLNELGDYYKENKVDLTIEEINELTYCAFYDQQIENYFRGLIVSSTDMNDIVEIYRVDTGSVHKVPVDFIQPLVAEFCVLPPFARCCHLAGVELPDTKEFNERVEIFLNEYIAKSCSIEVDDNTSESLGVFVHLLTGEILNDLIVARGITNKVQSPVHRRIKVHGPPEAVEKDETEDCPEYEDALEAVSGYHNRDEADICKHYKGGPEKSCFKGPRCKKKHIMMHPDGWTLDKVEVVAKYKSVPLPQPGSFLKVLITYVCHFDRLYVHIMDGNEQDLPTPSVSDLAPPMTLKALEKEMNKATTIMAYKRFKLYPAPGEMVAAIYPPDGLWYRARVYSHNQALNIIQVSFIDYGNVLELQEDQIRQLPVAFADLPVQAVKCVLAGVNMKSDNSYNKWVEAKTALSDMTLNNILEAHVIARNYDDITVELFDKQGYSVAEQLAARNLVTLDTFSVIDDTNTTTKLVVP